MDYQIIDVWIAVFTGVFFSIFVTNFFVFWKLDEMHVQMLSNNKNIKRELAYFYETLVYYMENDSEDDSDIDSDDDNKKDNEEQSKNFTHSESDKNSDTEIYNSDFEQIIQEDDIISEILDEPDVDVNDDADDL